MIAKLRMWRRMRGTPQAAGCLEVARALQAYLDHQVDDVTARRVARHLEECRRCGLEASTYTEIKHALGRQGTPLPGDALDRLRMFGERLAEQGHEDAADGSV